MARLTFIFLLLVTSGLVLAQDDERTQTIGDFVFDLQNDIWQHTVLPDEYEIEEKNACVYKDERWQQWFNEGDDTLRAILELQNVVFQSVSSADNQTYIFCVLDDDDKVECAVEHGRAYIVGDEDCGFLAAWLTPKNVILGTTGVIGAAIIIDNVGDDDEASPVRKK